jgi:hypothetical protein
MVCTTSFVAGSSASTPDSVDTHTLPPPKAMLRVVPVSVDLRLHSGRLRIDAPHDRGVMRYPERAGAVATAPGPVSASS